MMTDDEVQKARTLVGVVLGIFLVYIVACAGGVVPNDYDVFEYFQEEDEVRLVGGTGYVDGIPTTVNVTAQENNSFQMSVVCNESYISDMTFVLDPASALDNTTVYWTAMSTDWKISNDQLTAVYEGDALGIGVTDSNLVLHIDGGDVDGEIDLDIVVGTGEIDTDEFEIAVETWSGA